MVFEQSPEDAFVADIKKILLNEAAYLLENERDPLFFTQWGACFSGLIRAIRQVHGNHIVDNDCLAIRIITGFSKAETHGAAYEQLNLFMNDLRAAKGNAQLTFSLMASALNKKRLPDLMTGKILQTTPKMSVADQTASLLSHMMEDGRDEIGKYMDAVLFASDKIAEKVGLVGGFVKPFEINALETVARMGEMAEQISEEFFEAQKYFEAGIYAMVAMMCFQRTGRYRSNPTDAKIAEMVVEAYGFARAARTD